MPRAFVIGCLAALALALAACQSVMAAPLTPTHSPSTPTPSPLRTTTPAPVDLTVPGAAQRMLQRLVAAAGTDRVIMAEVTAESASISVLPPGSTEPVTWAYRDQEMQQVASDLQYVDQATFSLDDFDLSDVGQLFRVAARLSSSTQRQTLQIVDYSGGRVMMTVTTNPESRTVFFNTDGSLLPELDYHTRSGLIDGLAVVIDDRPAIRQLGVDSEAGAWVEYTGSNRTTIRRHRPPKVPVTTVRYDDPPALPAFPTGSIDPDAIWLVVERTIREEGWDGQVEWSVTVDDRAETGVPRMYFTIGTESLVTDLDGQELPDS